MNTDNLLHALPGMCSSQRVKIKIVNGPVKNTRLFFFLVGRGGISAGPYNLHAAVAYAAYAEVFCKVETEKETLI